MPISRHEGSVEITRPVCNVGARRTLKCLAVPGQRLPALRHRSAAFHGIRCQTIRANPLRSPGCTVLNLQIPCVRRDNDAWAHLLQSNSCVNATQAGISMSDYNVTSTNHRHRSVAGECIVLLLGAMLASCG